MGPQVTAGLSTVCVPSEGRLGMGGEGDTGWKASLTAANGKQKGGRRGATYRALSALLRTRYIS